MSFLFRRLSRGKQQEEPALCEQCNGALTSDEERLCCICHGKLWKRIRESSKEHIQVLEGQTPEGQPCRTDSTPSYTPSSAPSDLSTNPGVAPGIVKKTTLLSL
eukprot:TRINITY_DN54333_c0_g1_i1.p1 TRINITY_DN54333_c0_g1~~TRINITY_DN54333_c0_g1_i1.p1  ORF type:complete len:104 (-),score=12.24 TRINITY_DN54333_c0_g1_i1:33-344(-)